MELPFFIQFASERIGKQISAFTKGDWQQAAMAAAKIVDIYFDQLYPPPKRRGRPPKKRTLSDLMRTPPKKAKRGAPNKEYYGLSPTAILEIIEDLRSPEGRKKWPDYTKTESKTRLALLAILSRKSGAIRHDPSSVARAIRRVKADKYKNKR